MATNIDARAIVRDEYELLFDLVGGSLHMDHDWSRAWQELRSHHATLDVSIEPESREAMFSVGVISATALFTVLAFFTRACQVVAAGTERPRRVLGSVRAGARHLRRRAFAL
ncbi:MAG: hypothetical protein ABSE49_13500 [Polyangiaceae bacterium]|jgi:hypothetical protein